MMNTVAAVCCQSRRPRLGRTARLVGWLLGLWAVCGPLRAEPPPTASPEPPGWQRELDAARMLEASAELMPARDPAAAAERDSRLGHLYRQLAQKYPERAAVQKAAGDYLWKKDEQADAFAAWQRAQALDSKDAETASALGSAYVRLGKVGEARAQFQRAVDARPENPAYHFDLANVLYLFRNEFVDPPALPDAEAVLRQALAHFRRASELAPQDAQLARAYAETFYILAKPDWSDALNAWTTVRALDAPATDFANSHLARVSLRMGKPDQSETYLALMHDPAYASMRTTLQKQSDKLRRSQSPSATPPESGDRLPDR